jgi:hypothetical protein
MKYILFTVLVLFAQLSFGRESADYIFKNVHVITMTNDRIIENQSVVIKGGKIIDISSRTKLKAKTIIDAKGKFLMPTMADAHVHIPDNQKNLEKMLRLNLINGVTKIRSMRGNWKDTEYREKYNGPDSFYPKFYLSPPPIHRSQDLSYEELENAVKAAKENRFDFIKILSIKTPELLQQLTALCEKYKVNLGGHFPNNPGGQVFEDTLVFRPRFNYLEHLGGLIGAPDKYENRIKAIKENNVFICPTMQWYAIAYGQYDIDEMISQRGMEYMPKAIVSDWAEKTKQYRDNLGKAEFEAERLKYAQEMQERYKVVKRLNEEGVKLLLSPDCSANFTVPGFGIREEMKLYQSAGLTNYDILRTATVNFALLFNENYGTIEKGKDADFMLLDSNPLQNLKALENVRSIFYNNTYLAEEALQQMKKTILPD